MAQLKVGTAQIDITPPMGCRMAGYGSRTEGAQGIHDNLYARAMVLDDGATKVAIVACDVAGLDKHPVATIRQVVAELTDIPGDHVMVCTTHTHSGPSVRTGRGAPEELIEITARKIAGAVAIADRNRREGVLKVGRGRVSSVSQNRRHPDWPTDPTLKVLRADTPERQPIGAILNYPCHGTVMNADNLMISADYPGSTVRTVQRVIGEDVPILFINGAFGNINPVWTEQVFAEVERNGMILGGEAIKVLAEIEAAGQRIQVHNIRLREWPEHKVQGELITDVCLAVSSRTVKLPFKELLSEEEYDRLLAGLREELVAAAGPEALTKATDWREELAAAATPEELSRQAIWRQGLEDYLERVVSMDEDTLTERRRISALLTKTSRDKTTIGRIRGMRSENRDYRATEIQAIGVSPRLAFVSVPGELFVEIGQAIEQQSPVAHLFLCGNSNDSVCYLITPEAYEQGGYEAGTTLFAPQTDAIIREAAVDAVTEVTA